MTVRYTAGQLRDAVSISQETYRHWRKALPVLRRGAGPGPKFTAGDLLATAVVRTLTFDFAIRVSAVSLISPALFETCNRPWPVLERGKLVVDLAAGDLQLVGIAEPHQPQAPVLIVPLQSSISRIRAALFTQPDRSGMQESLPLPPARTSSVPGSGTVEVQA